MTIGEKIKYFRTCIGITQGKLAELSGIHPVSIRKYETNKMVPQTPHIIKLAEALNVSPFAFTDFCDGIKLQTSGDMIGYLLMLLKNNVLYLDGERDEKGRIKKETAVLKTHKLLNANYEIKSDDKQIPLDTAFIKITSDRLLEDIIMWDKYMHSYKLMVEGLSGNTDKTVQKSVDMYKDAIELLELKMYESNIMFNEDGGISVKIPPNYFG